MEVVPSYRSCFERYAFDDDGFFTFTSTEQKRVEDLVNEQLRQYVDVKESPVLLRRAHVDYIVKSLHEVGKGYTGLDASRTWMCFWGLHSLNILGAPPPHSLKNEILSFLKTCQHPNGGFGVLQYYGPHALTPPPVEGITAYKKVSYPQAAGGPGQHAHLAPTYAAVMALASLQSEEALKAINLETLSRFLHQMKQPDGSFTMHDGGEADIRGTYCALSVAALCGLMTDALKDGAAEWIIKCQTYEGGFGGEPNAEAHGGYAYCAVASLVILDRYRLADSELLVHWLANRQMRYEGGFQGRTNKLVDGCYSFWQAANFPLIEGEMAREGRLPAEGLFDARMLEEYIMMSCQDEAGGFRDKPDKPRDLYHTCYVLSGLAIAQSYSAAREPDGIFGGSQNAVEPINPVFNLTTHSEQFAESFFAKSRH